MKCPLCQQHKIQLSQCSGKRLDLLLFNLANNANKTDDMEKWVYGSAKPGADRVVRWPR